MGIELRLLTTSDVDDLYPRLRNEDKNETILLGSNPREALLMGAFDNVFSSVSNGRAYAIVDDNQVIGAIGFSSGGYLWALSTVFTRSQRRELFERTPEITARLLREATSKGALAGDLFLSNMIHSRNKVSLKWLERSGIFEVERDNPIELNGEVFYPFRTLLPHELATAPAPVRIQTACASPSLH